VPSPRVATAFGLTLRLAPRDRALLAAWVALSVSVFAVWLAALGWMAWTPAPMPSWLAPLVVVSFGLPAAWWTRRRAVGEVALLHWREGAWYLAAPDDPERRDGGRVEPMIDLGGWMLLRFRSDESKLERWFVADPAQAGSTWHDMRAALYRPAQAGVPRGQAQARRQ